MSGAAEGRWSRDDAAWREPSEVVGLWGGGEQVEPSLLRTRARGRFWETLAERELCLLVTREYEHLVMALEVHEGRPRTTFLRLPHPSGLAVDERRGVVHLASTRNPNQLLELEPVETRAFPDRPLLLPVRGRFLPGSLYLHDLAILGGQLHGNAVGHNAVVVFPRGRGWRRVWWPRSIEGAEGPDFGRNYLQLNSIAAGPTLARSFFSASAATPGRRRPGQRSFPVDRRGVIFSGATREPLVVGLTRPHSARLHGGRLYVANSGYGELLAVEGGELAVVARLRGWTRGLWLGEGLAVVGTSRVIPRFRSYAPGLEVDGSECGLHLVELGSGRVLGSLIWPEGNQLFAIEALPEPMRASFPFSVGRRGAAATARIRAAFYDFAPRGDAETRHG